MVTIKITERQERLILKSVLDEEYGGWSDKVKTVKDYLDQHFSRASATLIGDDGKPENKEVVAWLDDNKQIVKTLTDVQLFYVIQDEFKNIISDKEARDNFLKQVIKDWYSHKISKNNTLSAY